MCFLDLLASGILYVSQICKPASSSLFQMFSKFYKVDVKTSVDASFRCKVLQLFELQVVPSSYTVVIWAC